MPGAAGPRVTSAAAVERTLTVARDGFAGAGLDDAWERVVAVVVQPGVEFGDETVADYDHAVARDYGVAYDSFLPEKNLGQFGVPKRSAFIVDKAGIVHQDQALRQAAGQAFYNTSKFTLRDLKARASQQQLKADFEAYLDGFSPNVQDILEKFEFRNQIPRLSKADALGTLIEKLLDSSKVRAMGWKPEISLLAGLKATYQDFLRETAQR